MKEILKLYNNNSLIVAAAQKIAAEKTSVIHLKSLSGSARALYIQQILSILKGSHLIILNDKEEAAYFYNDLTTLDGFERSLFFPSSYARSIQYKKTDEANIITRTQVLKRLSERRTASFIVTYPEAIMEKVISRKVLNENSFEIKAGDKLDRDFLHELLISYNFSLVDFVYEPGQYALRGSIIDVFSFASSYPLRIDFFGNEVESVRSFDVDNQLSIEKLKKFTLIPNIQWESEKDSKRLSLFEYLPDTTMIWMHDSGVIFNKVDEVYEKAIIVEENPAFDKSTVISNTKQLIQDFQSYKKIEFGTPWLSDSPEVIQFNTSPQPSFNRNFNLLVDDILKNESEAYAIHILSENESQLVRLRNIFKEINEKADFIPGNIILHEGFIDHHAKICVYTDHQIFDRYHKYKIHDRFSRKESINFKELTDLKPGDYVVHIDHGIGIFGGLETIEKSGKKQESIRLVYKDKDVLYVSIHALHRISKYKGKDNEQPKIYKLGGGAWQKLKTNTKKKVKDIAVELIKLYAKRKLEEGYGFSKDTYLQEELEASFIYEDTPDQITATQAVKEGMEAKFPMDRLICGDVGFGKTEIAIRAAFKAVTDSRQVAVLVPTTILALQHYNTFLERLKGFPCNVDYISRLRSSAQQKESIKNLKEGKTDIIIGTHKLIGKEVVFKDLGLLIIDEEQKFGVGLKEKLREVKVNVDTLTLTATPIPRTLQFSLMGARDLSIINTPPPNRHPIITELHSFSEDIIKEAIEYEVARGGQVFFIHNRVQNIAEVEALINRTNKGVRTVVAHGQMEGKKLESIMLDFIQGYYDVLIATTIVESGLDIPNANTIIINNAQNFGLSDLHQLRGRVGRSNKKAFCYLLAPPLHLNTPEARRRLKAIEEYSELGSGFNIAMQDLDIRGAGNLLGAEQSGFIADIGFETYHKILNEALQELKDNEFKELFEEEEKKKPERDYVSDCLIDTDFELLFPETYIYNIAERISLYRELDNATREADLDSFRERLLDRFGPIPEQSLDLINIVTIRLLAQKSGVEKINLKNKKMTMFFVSDQDSSYYQSAAFGKVLQFVQTRTRSVQMKEENGRLSLRVENVESVNRAISILREMIL
ncbi:MAG: transcription-repair coupling factor [Bacteroidales bacterium]|nr:transcription-repair coupling factor [Bacteroidales bacterium]MCF8390838.1 transcription-repair coupling factor [Bacteroidales bacterium]